MDDRANGMIVDPLSKEPLTREGDVLRSPYGREYPVVDEIYDLRLLNNETTGDQLSWSEGQREYEAFFSRLSEEDCLEHYLAEIEGVREVYSDIKVEGSCLDVGGGQGRVRAFLEPGQFYVSCDPLLKSLEDLDRRPNLLKAYPFLRDPVNFVCCDAEFLPFPSNSFDTVHMRSVIDHLLSPELALNEAFRVLRPEGSLIVGAWVRGGRRGRSTVQSRMKEIARLLFRLAGWKRFRDHHAWHPTFAELTRLVGNTGFDIGKVHWQKGYDDTVCYIQAAKRSGLSRRT